MKHKITIITINWFAEDFAKLLINSVIKTTNNNLEIIIIDNSKELKEEDFKGVRIIKPEKNLGHGGGLDLGIKEAKGDYILILDIDAHLLLENWDSELIDLFENNKELKLACATDGGLLKPARPLAMFFEKETIKNCEISFKAINLGGVKFDVGLHAYFKTLTKYGDKSIFKLPSRKTEFKDVLGNEYLLNGKRFVYHNWYGTRWYNVYGKRVHDKIDRVDWEMFKQKKDNLFKQI